MNCGFDPKKVEETLDFGPGLRRRTLSLVIPWDALPIRNSKSEIVQGGKT
jgi:hypothetical protein